MITVAMTTAEGAIVAAQDRPPGFVLSSGKNNAETGKPGLLAMVGTFGLCLALGLFEAARISARQRR